MSDTRPLPAPRIEFRCLLFRLNGFSIRIRQGFAFDRNPQQFQTWRKSINDQTDEEERKSKTRTNNHDGIDCRTYNIRSTYEVCRMRPTGQPAAHQSQAWNGLHLFSHLGKRFHYAVHIFLSLNRKLFSMEMISVSLLFSVFIWPTPDQSATWLALKCP